MKVNLQQENFIFHPSGVAYWESKDILLIADVHLGKISHFRKHGSAVPMEAISENFDRLTSVIEQYKPKEVYFMGDLFHSVLNKEFLVFKEWIDQQELKITLIIGNHDIIPDFYFEELGIELAQEIILSGFLFTHHPEEREGFFNICGHIHPGFRLRGMGRQHEKLRCFLKTKHQLILPAFGTFTGNYFVKPKEGDTIYVCAPTEVIRVV